MNRLFFFVVALLLMRCENDRRAEVIGTWKIDSVYSYYNRYGFTHYNPPVNPLFHFQADGKLKMTLKEESRFQTYTLPHPDSLVFYGPDSTVVAKYLIVELTENRLVLKERKQPLFKGENQERYELKYFSRAKGS